MHLEHLQQEVGEWSRQNFGDQSHLNPLLGSIEEIGELARAVSYGAKLEDIEDAIGDAIVYLADFCARRNISLREAYMVGERVGGLDDVDWAAEILIAYYYLVHSELKLEQGIRLDEPDVGDRATIRAIGYLLIALEGVAHVHGSILEDCIEEAWGEVSQREWDSAYIK